MPTKSIVRMANIPSLWIQKPLNQKVEKDIRCQPLLCSLCKLSFHFNIIYNLYMVNLRQYGAITKFISFNNIKTLKLNHSGNCTALCIPTWEKYSRVWARTMDNSAQCFMLRFSTFCGYFVNKSISRKVVWQER